MSDIHDLIAKYGVDIAKKMAPDARLEIDIARRLLTDEDQAMGFAYSGFCLTSLPHRRLPDGSRWERHGAVATLVIEPGVLQVKDEIKQFGVPYGSRARLILLYLQTIAIRNQSPFVELGRSLRDWMTRMDMSDGGKDYSGIREQAARISACHLTFFWKNDRGHDRFHKDSIITGGAQITLQAESDQPMLWEDTVKLSDTFFKSLVSHPVPILESAVRAISGKSMALDIYIWLAYRLHNLTHPTPVRWAALYSQFGGGYGALKHFKPEFLRSLHLALAAYPDAKIRCLDDGSGLDLHPSRPPIPMKLLNSQ